MNKKIKLIFYHPVSDIGGADNSLFRLIDNLDSKKFSISFLSLNESFLKSKLKKNIKFITLKANRALFSFFELRRIIQENIQKKKYEKIILVSNQNYANLISIMSTYKLKKVKTILIDRNHIDELKICFSLNEYIRKKIIKFLMWLFYRQADMVIGISKKLSEDLNKLINKKVITIYNPAFDKTILKKSKEKTYSINTKKYILNISRFTKRKDHITTLLAFKDVQKKIEDIKLVLIGYGPEIKNIKIISKKLRIQKNLKIIKKCHNPYPILRKAKLLVHTSLYEGFCNVLVEALMLNIPVISTKCNAGPSEILLNGKGGDLIKNQNYKDLSNKIENYFKNPKVLRNKTKIAKRKLYRFEIKKHVKKYTNLFIKI